MIDLRFVVFASHFVLAHTPIAASLSREIPRHEPSTYRKTKSQLQVCVGQMTHAQSPGLDSKSFFPQVSYRREIDLAAPNCTERQDAELESYSLV